VKNSTYLLVYGTLRKAVAHPRHRILDQYGVFQGMGTFRGKLYDLGRYPGATVSDKDSDRVVGEVYRLRGEAKALSLLDEYEGELFQRTQISVLLNDQKTIIAWTYLYKGPLGTRRRITNGDYVEFLDQP